MRTFAIALLAAVLLPAAAHAATDSATFKVSAYGVQRYVNAWTENEDTRPLPCGDRRGPISEGTVVRFKTTSPTKVRVTRSGGTTTLTVLRSKGIYPFAGEGDWQHTYEDGSSYWDCETESEVPAPPEPKGDCSENVAIGLDFEATTVRGGRIQMSGGQEIPPVDPFPGCNHGDHSMGIYPAKGTLPANLLDAEEAEVVLRGSEHDEFESDAPNMGVGGWKKRITLYLVFKRVR